METITTPRPRRTPPSPMVSLIGACLWLVIAIFFLVGALLRLADTLAQHKHATAAEVFLIVLWATVLAVWTWIGGNAFSRYRRERNNAGKVV